MCLPASALIPLTCDCARPRGCSGGGAAAPNSTRGLMAGARHSTRVAAEPRGPCCRQVNWLRVRCGVGWMGMWPVVAVDTCFGKLRIQFSAVCASSYLCEWVHVPPLPCCPVYRLCHAVPCTAFAMLSLVPPLPCCPVYGPPRLFPCRAFASFPMYVRPFPLTTGVVCTQAAIRESDAVVTVSPGYAQEIQNDPLLTVVRDAQHVQKPVLGIMNGIDTSTWSPDTDPYLLPALRYGQEQAGPAKLLAKLLLQVGGPPLQHARI